VSDLDTSGVKNWSLCRWKILSKAEYS